MKKKLIAFDLDGTLADSKAPLSDEMINLLGQLLEHFQVCVISGGKYELFQKQVLDNLQIEPKRLANLHLMPTCGTRYYTYDLKQAGWRMVYAEDLTKTQKDKIVEALNKALDELGWREKKTWGALIEDRKSQVTLSVLGQEAPLDAKEAWDPSGNKKMRLRDVIAPMIPDLEVRAGGTTSIDVTKPGIDKAFGMRKLMEHTGVTKEQILFMGDKLTEGGNDYPVKAMGIDSLEVSHWRDTALEITGILHAV